jgi:hypothetical protein
MPRTSLLAAALTAVAYLAVPSTAAADVQLTMQDGRVSIKATNATVREILAEWAKIGQARIVNGERLPGGPVTLELTDVPESQALDVLLRTAAGYMAAPRPTPVPNASQFDRILILPTSTPPPRVAPAPPPPAFPQQPQFSPPLDDDDEDDDPRGPVPVPRAPAFNTFPPPAQPGMPPPAQPVSPQPAAAPPNFPFNPVPVPRGGNPAASPTPAAPQMPVGVPVPGMVIPQPAPQPGQVQPQ